MVDKYLTKTNTRKPSAYTETSLHISLEIKASNLYMPGLTLSKFWLFDINADSIIFLLTISLQYKTTLALSQSIPWLKVFICKNNALEVCPVLTLYLCWSILLANPLLDWPRYLQLQLLQGTW